MPQPKPYTLRLDLQFQTPTEALAWFDGLRHRGFLPEGSDLFHPDALDAAQRGYTNRDLIVRRSSDRIGSLAVRANKGASSGR